MHMDTAQGHSSKPVTLNSDIFAYENEWVALDTDNAVVEHATRLPELLQKLTPEQEAQGLTFMQVLPRDMAFVGSRV